jgi:hypothetical protein
MHFGHRVAEEMWVKMCSGLRCRPRGARTREPTDYQLPAGLCHALGFVLVGGPKVYLQCNRTCRFMRASAQLGYDAGTAPVRLRCDRSSPSRNSRRVGTCQQRRSDTRQEPRAQSHAVLAHLGRALARLIRLVKPRRVSSYGGGYRPLTLPFAAPTTGLVEVIRRHGTNQVL